MFDATIDMTRPSEIPSDKSFIFVKLSGGNGPLHKQFTAHSSTAVMSNSFVKVI